MTTDPQLLSTLERRNRELEVLIEIGKALTSTLEIEGVLDLIMDQLSRLLKFESLLQRSRRPLHPYGASSGGQLQKTWRSPWT